MIEPYKIDSECEADAYLSELLAKDEYRNMSEVEDRAIHLISDAKLRDYFIERGREILKS